MDDKRYKELDELGSGITEDEFRNFGWHFCAGLDGLLVDKTDCWCGLFPEPKAEPELKETLF